MKGMLRLRRSRRRVLVTAVAVATATLALTSCSRRIAQPDPSYTSPEGVPSDSAVLVVWADEANQLHLFQDQPPADPDAGDTPIGVEDRRRAAAGAIHGMVFDGTAASAYQVFRRESNGGVRQFSDVEAVRTQRWLESGWEAYRFRDERPAGAAPAYIARGLLGGVANARSPLTREARAGFTPVDDIGLRAVWFPPRLGVKLTWNDVPNAARYWVQIYSFRGDLRDINEKILSGTPGPLYDGQSHNVFVASLPAPRNFYIAGFHSVRDSALDKVQILSIRAGDFLNIARVGDRRDTTAARQPYRVRVSAVDADGRLIATARGPADLLAAYRAGAVELQRGAAGLGTYGLYRLNSTVAQDTAVVLPGPALAPATALPAATPIRHRAARAARL